MVLSTDKKSQSEKTLKLPPIVTKEDPLSEIADLERQLVECKQEREQGYVVVNDDGERWR